MNSVRQLALPDIDTERWTVRWEGEFDKANETRVNPLHEVARACIRRVL
jgi:hypothetical protein